MASLTIDEEPKRKVGRIRYFISVLILIPLMIVLFLFKNGQFRALEVTSDSMANTLLIGDRLIARKFAAGGLNRGDIVVLHSPDDDGPDLVKRLVARPGDTYEFRAGELYVNGKLVPLPSEGIPYGRSYLVPPEKLGSDSYLVLGDNRPNSHDSREFGSVGEASIFGKVIYRYGPSDRRGSIQGGTDE